MPCDAFGWLTNHGDVGQTVALVVHEPAFSGISAIDRPFETSNGIRTTAKIEPNLEGYSSGHRHRHGPSLIHHGGIAPPSAAMPGRAGEQRGGCLDEEIHQAGGWRGGTGHYLGDRGHGWALPRSRRLPRSALASGARADIGVGQGQTALGEQFPQPRQRRFHRIAYRRVCAQELDAHALIWLHRDAHFQGPEMGGVEAQFGMLNLIAHHPQDPRAQFAIPIGMTYG